MTYYHALLTALIILSLGAVIAVSGRLFEIFGARRPLSRKLVVYLPSGSKLTLDHYNGPDDIEILRDAVKKAEDSKKPRMITLEGSSDDLFSIVLANLNRIPARVLPLLIGVSGLLLGLLVATIVLSDTSSLVNDTSSLTFVLICGVVFSVTSVATILLWISIGMKREVGRDSNAEQDGYFRKR